MESVDSSSDEGGEMVVLDPDHVSIKYNYQPTYTLGVAEGNGYHRICNNHIQHVSQKK